MMSFARRNVLLLSGADDERLRSLRRLLGHALQVDSIDRYEAANPAACLGRPARILRLAPTRIQVAQWDPHESGTCPGCLDRRCRQREAELSSAGGLFAAVLPITSFAVDILASLCQLKLPAGSGVDFDLEALCWRPFWIEPDPACACCASQSREEELPVGIELQARAKRAPAAYRALEVDRLCEPTRYLNQTCGFLGPTYTRSLFSPFGARVQGAFSYRGHRVAWGANSSTYGRALMIGLCEAFERHASHGPRTNQRVVFARLGDLQDHALDPRECGLYDSTFHEANPSVERFSEDLRVRWIDGYSLTEARPILVPTQLVYYGVELKGEERFVFSNSNGCATGSSLEEAIFFAILEVIERDSFMMHWLACLSPVRIDLDSIKNPDLHILRARLRQAGYQLSVLDARLDISVPALIAVAQRLDDDYGAFAIGACSHFEPETAIVSSVSDAAARIVGFTERTRRAATRLGRLLADPTSVRVISDHAALYGLPEAARQAAFLTAGHVEEYSRLFDGWNRERPRSMDLRDDIEWLMAMLVRVGLRRVIVVDLTSPEGLRAGLHTVKVLIPGALPIDFGYGKLRVAGLPRFSVLAAKYGKPGALSRTPHPFA